MNKILVVIVVLALVWAIPPVRMKVLAAATPVLERLGPVGEKLLSPSRRYGTQNEVISIARLIANDQDEGRPLPEESTFHQWVTRRIHREDGIDAWGNRFWIKINSKNVTVGSSGPDGKRNTDDDVTYTAAF